VGASRKSVISNNPIKCILNALKSAKLFFCVVPKSRELEQSSRESSRGKRRRP